jgi:NosR/NirI family transcriptional regulator, nitrous oxide reductase regulator
LRYSKDRFDEILEILSTAGDRPPGIGSIYLRKAIVSCALAVFRVLGALTLMVALAGLDVGSVNAAESRLPNFLKSLEPGNIFPGANRYGPVEGSPPAAAAFGGDRLLGYVYLNADVVNSTGYSGKPINIVVGIDLNGKIVGLELVEHHEPIVLIGIPPSKITTFLKGYIGHNFLETPSVNIAAPPVDIISGATVTVMVIADSLTRSAIRTARLKRAWHCARGARACSAGRR